jgi:hypothetical protein
MKKIWILSIAFLTSYCGILFAEELITLKVIFADGTNKEIIVDSQIIELAFSPNKLLKGYSYSERIVDVEGIEKLNSLESVYFSRAPYFDSLDFIKKATQIKKLGFFLHFEYIETSQFLPYLTDLKYFIAGEGVNFILGELNFSANSELKEIYIDYCTDTKPSPIMWDLSTNPKLEKITIYGCNLDNYPLLKNIPERLNYLDLSRNNISNHIIPENYKQIDKIYLGSNGLNEIILDKHSNVCFEKSDQTQYDDLK